MRSGLKGSIELFSSPLPGAPTPHYNNLVKTFTNNWTGSATALTNFLFGNWSPPLNSFKGQFQYMKGSTLNDLPMNQEWCHLMGHGDGGGEIPENLVSGSRHCNTEQLAIESAQRHITHKSGGQHSYTLATTAYLFNTEGSMTTPFGSGYLKPGQSQDGADPKKGRDHDNPGIASSKQKEINSANKNAPIAQFIRYKIYRNVVGSAPVKVFDYVFEAQSEFFDINQANILYANVLFALDPNAFQKAELPAKGSKAVIDGYLAEALAPK